MPPDYQRRLGVTGTFQPPSLDLPASSALIHGLPDQR